MTFHVDGLDRHTPSNPYLYSEEQLFEKKRALDELSRLYPDVNPTWREWIYDLCKNTPEDELEAMKARIDASPPRPPSIDEPKNTCGEINNDDALTQPESP